jgi:branched-chain amino acid aminotransferase
MSQKVWLNDHITGYVEAQLDSAGWPAGQGIFETIKTVDGKPWATSRHMRRALTAARRLGIFFPSEEIQRRAISELIAVTPFPIGRLRLHFGEDRNFCITHHEYKELTEPAKLIIFDERINSDQVILKRYPYTHNLALLNTAQSAGFDDGLVINDRGEISESAVSNVIFRQAGIWRTPPITSSILPGVMRALVVEKLGIKVSPILQHDLPNISAGFLLSSLKIAQPISKVANFDLTVDSESLEMQVKIVELARVTSVG